MTDVMPEPQAVDLDELVGDEPVGADGPDAVDEQLIARLAGRARAGGLQLAGEGGLLAQLTKRLVESALEGEITDHLGYDKHDAGGRDGANSRNGHRSKTVLTEAWGERYPAIVRLWENAWAEFVPFLSFDAEIRKIVYTTNASD
jgi:putative transposase